MEALNVASGYKIQQCLLGLGSYLGGESFLQDLSTSMYDASCCVSIPKYVENVSDLCLDLGLPLPYHIPGGITEEELLDLEYECLRHLHMVAIMHQFMGTPKLALLLEVILGGHGTTLTERFLIRLGLLCFVHGICIIVDEVLTGGRTGGRTGRSMCMTTDMPEEFIQCVGYICMGKFMKCAMVLKKIPTRPTEVRERLRGTSTSLDCSLPYQHFKKTMEALARGDLMRRQEEVLRIMKVLDNASCWWGLGLLLFTIYRRSQTTTALKNRLLPMLEPGLKSRKQTCRKSKWNPKIITELVTNIAREWIVHQQTRNAQNAKTAFLWNTIDLLFHDGKGRLEPQESTDAGYLRLRAVDVVNFMGTKKC